ncbi:hypothetical protein ACQ86N_17455 [Puia sp. P3]|uniref:hypothetical protein n=1 Tax=Puia sp. P3 TaxID=3423952 RepID=UPI003D66FE1F
MPAADYGPYLKRWGFQVLTKDVTASDYTPTNGDVVVFEGFEGHENGHIAMYNGTQWVSDFKQNYFTPGEAYRKDPRIPT